MLEARRSRRDVRGHGRGLEREAVLLGCFRRLRGLDPLVAVEHEPDGAGHVEGGEQGGSGADDPHAVVTGEVRASQATMNPRAVNGRNLRSPPIVRMSWLSSVAWITDPAPRKSAAL